VGRNYLFAAHITAVVWFVGVLFGLFAVWVLLNSERFGRMLMRMNAWFSSAKKRAGRLQALHSGLLDLIEMWAPLLAIAPISDGFTVLLSHPTAESNPIWQWNVRWIGDLPFRFPGYEVEAIANPMHIRVVRDSGIYKSAQWAIRAINEHVDACAKNESVVQFVAKQMCEQGASVNS
jgi:hypothetical protein